MSYRYEKNLTGEQDLVIDGFDKGIADSPLEGIGNMRNVNISFYKGLAYTNYKRKPVTIQNSGGNSTRNFTVTVASPGVFTAVTHTLVIGNVMTLSTTGALPTGLTTGIAYYVVSIPTVDTFTLSATLGGSAINTTGTQSGTHTFTMSMTIPAYQCQTPAGVIYISDVAGNIYQQSAANSSTFRILTGCPGTPNKGLQYWSGALLAWDSTQINIYDGAWNTAAGTTGVWPIKSATLSLTGTPSAGDTSATISSYTDGQGNNRAFWNGPSGSYPVRFTQAAPYTSQIVFATMTQGAAGFSFFPALNAAASAGTASLQPMQGIYSHPSLVSINDGNCYFGNDTYVGSLGVLPNQVFSKGNMISYNFNGAALALPQTEAVLCMTELRNQLLVGSFFKVYPWDRISSSWLNPIPVLEYMYGMINILNNVYIFAGNKGNIYVSNGYNAQRFKKIPDYISGLIDPSWNWGGIMSHRQKLFFTALAINSGTGVPVLSGIFSLDLDTLVLNMESQNSFGLAASTTTSPALLVDNNSITLNYDNFYSAWASGIDNGGGIDYNDTTLWSGSEVVIESDLIPIGTFFQQKTYTSAEFKLDQPMQSGDTISLYARQSLSDSFTLIGTTTTAVLSDSAQKMPFQNWQWIQFQVVVSCNATVTSSSRVPLRELRIR